MGEIKQDAQVRPTDRAMRAAVSMEVHAACSTRTIDKARALDEGFPGYDEALEALKRIVNPAPGVSQKAPAWVYGIARAALSKASPSEGGEA